MTAAWRRIALLVLVLVASSVLIPAPTQGVQSFPAAAPRAYTVPPTMTMNDPTHRPGQIARQLRRYINETPRGATISIMSFYLSSSITWPALKAAYRRGVRIRAVLYGGDQGVPLKKLSWEGAKLTEMIAAGRKQGRTGSWVVWTKNTARGKDAPSTVMHAKFWQFSQVGASRKVTMIGSYNNGDLPDGRAYSAMFTMAEPKFYDVVQRIFREGAKDRRVKGNPQRRAKGDGWDAYFMPSTPITKKNDPVLERLQKLPADENTRMVVSMYSWQGARGLWLAKRLATMLDRGAHLTVVVGPDVSRPVLDVLRRAGARLEDGCWRTGRKKVPYAYTHDKEMTATWVGDDGTRRYAAWIGSDDWGNGSGGSQSDQANIGLFSKWAYTRLNQLLAPQIAHRPDNLAPCDPL